MASLSFFVFDAALIIHPGYGRPGYTPLANKDHAEKHVT